MWEPPRPPTAAGGSPEAPRLGRGGLPLLPLGLVHVHEDVAIGPAGAADHPGEAGGRHGRVVVPPPAARPEPPHVRHVARCDHPRTP